MKRQLINIFIFSFLFFTNLLATETVVVGTVLDEYTGQPIENVHIYYKGTQVGCTTNQEGLFMLRVDMKNNHTLIVSAIGYKTHKYKIEEGQHVGIQILMREDNNLLADIFVKPDENIALGLLAKVRANRHKNDISLNEHHTQFFHEQKQLYISDIEKKHLQRAIWKSLKTGMISAEDSTMLIPLYFSGQDFQIQGNTILPLSDIQERSAVLTHTDYSILLNGIEHRVNFYNNNINIFGKTFISPLATNSSKYYKFYLADSIQHQGEKHYLIHFKTQNPYQLTFNGEMTIDSATYALRTIDAQVPRQSSVNYLSSIQLHQIFNTDNTLYSEDLSLIFDFAIKADNSHTFPTALLKRNISTQTTKQTFSQTDDKSTAPPIVNDSTSTAAMDSLTNIPIIKFANFIAYIVNTRNIPTGECIDIGPIHKIFNYNHYEGARIGIPLTTNEKLFKRVELSAYVGYGFTDKALKGQGKIRILLPTKKRNILGASYTDDYSRYELSSMDYYLHENSFLLGYQDLAHALFGSIRTQKQITTTAIRKTEGMIWLDSDWGHNIETTLSAHIGRMGYGNPYEGYTNMPSFRYNTFEAGIRIGWDERVVDRWFRRYHIHSNYPVLRIILSAGTYKLDSMEDAAPYARLSLMLQQTIHLGICGKLDYTATAGAVFGKVPFPLLNHFMGNQSYAYDPYRFSLMNESQYTADKYLTAHIHWNMEGLLFNKIPYIRALKLRELIEMKFAYGYLSNKHQEILPLPYSMKGLNTPYLELGAGIGNILRVIDLYAMFRLTNLQDKSTPWWGIKARFSFGL